VNLELVKVAAGSFQMGSNQSENEKPIHQVTLNAFRMSKYPITQKQYQAVMGNNLSRFQSDQNCPVEQVSWDEAVAFCKKLSQMTGQNVKLPSEAQWEYACRAGSHTKYCFGDNINQLGNYAWYDMNSGTKTHPVGEKSPNHWGLYDMHGNVWEWCEDLYHGNYNGAPNDGTAWLKDTARLAICRRGGSWYSNDIDCCSANRDWFYSRGNEYIGFRVVV
jgi:formylglycine-generating enzyme required for sulfatase activity